MHCALPLKQEHFVVNILKLSIRNGKSMRQVEVVGSSVTVSRATLLNNGLECKLLMDYHNLDTSMFANNLKDGLNYNALGFANVGATINSCNFTGNGGTGLFVVNSNSIGCNISYSGGISINSKELQKLNAISTDLDSAT